MKKRTRNARVAMCLLMETCLFSLAAVGETIHVDNNNTKGPWDGSAEYPWPRIQDGVDAASVGDTVAVEPGQYIENVNVWTSLTLVGAGASAPILHGGNDGDAIWIHAPEVAFRGFMIAQDFSSNAAGIRVQAERCVVAGNNLTACHVGVSLADSSGCLVRDNRLRDCFIGILANGGGQNVVVGNCLAACSTGIYLEESRYNWILLNRMGQSGRGLFLSYALGNGVMLNNLISNETQAEFTKFWSPGFLFPNRWMGNYWDDTPNAEVRMIPGTLYVPARRRFPSAYLPWVEIDRRPAKAPLPISVACVDAE